MWSNMCLGDLKRHNSEYTFSLPNLEGRTVATKNATTGKVEQFFDIKKKNGTELKFQILDFIQKCWNYNRALRRQL